MRPPCERASEQIGGSGNGIGTLIRLVCTCNQATASPHNLRGHSAEKVTITGALGQTALLHLAVVCRRCDFWLRRGCTSFQHAHAASKCRRDEHAQRVVACITYVLRSGSRAHKCCLTSCHAPSAPGELPATQRALPAALPAATKATAAAAAPRTPSSPRSRLAASHPVSNARIARGSHDDK
jgi:hypothetical protein